MIREATPADFHAVKRITEEVFLPYVLQTGEKPDALFADHANLIDKGLIEVSVSAKGIKGYCVSYPKAADWNIEALAVAPAFQGCGEGEMLLSDTENRAMALGFGSISLYANAAMDEAIEFYKSRGYVETGRAADKGAHRVYLKKELM